MRKLMWILILCGMCFAEYEWTGWGDTLTINNSLDSATVRYTTPISYSINELHEIWVTVLCDDTTQAGFASDSVNFSFGYQVGCLVIDSNSADNLAIDTAWERILVTLDTMTVDSFGVAENLAFITDEGELNVVAAGSIDTISVPGYASMMKLFRKPIGGHYLRYWANGLGNAQIASDSLKLYFNSQGTIR